MRRNALRLLRPTGSDFIQSMGKVNGKFVIILNVDHVLSLDEMSSLAHVGEAVAA
jgi:purine-binding chemotaxis protein CheW